MTTAQSLSDAAHRDPSRNIAAKLMRLAESWIEPPNRRWDRLEQMDRLVDSLRQTYAQELERAQREMLDRRLAGRPRKPIEWDDHVRPHLCEHEEPVELIGAGMSDKPLPTSNVPTFQCWGCGQTVRADERHQCEPKPPTTAKPLPLTSAEVSPHWCEACGATHSPGEPIMCSLASMDRAP